MAGINEPELQTTSPEGGRTVFSGREVLCVTTCQMYVPLPDMNNLSQPGTIERNQGSLEKKKGILRRIQGSLERKQGMLGTTQGLLERKQGMLGRNQGSLERKQGILGKNQGSLERKQKPERVLYPQKGPCDLYLLSSPLPANNGGLAAACSGAQHGVYSRISVCLSDLTFSLADL